MDFQRRFGGIARLYGDEALQRFVAAHVCLIGIGGVGSWAAEALARSGVGAITLVDLDNLAESNINRQVHAMESQLGRAKVEAMAERIREINPACRITRVEDFAEPGNLDLLIHEGFDHVLDCIDSYRVKAALIAHCRRRKIPVVTAGGAGGRVDPLKIRMGDLSRTEHDPLLAKTRKLLRQDYGFSRNTKRRFGVPCVYSWEQARPPVSPEIACSSKVEGMTGLNCAGYGSSVAVTASFGLAAAAYVMSRLAVTGLTSPAIDETASPPVPVE
ncbi:MAG: tRNA cyclic N6-threonylcarbamoyladenosine(37) synthase TcdA [Gammaproteobacteria bacterium]|nr:tRNA cyclic N6-threonylcarbamoyladenosine(37) synthase TcdA [Gammaproteobacteria bacterium]